MRAATPPSAPPPSSGADRAGGTAIASPDKDGFDALLADARNFVGKHRDALAASLSLSLAGALLLGPTGFRFYSAPYVTLLVVIAGALGWFAPRLSFAALLTAAIPAIAYQDVALAPFALMLLPLVFMAAPVWTGALAATVAGLAAARGFLVFAPIVLLLAARTATPMRAVRLGVFGVVIVAFALTWAPPSAWFETFTFPNGAYPMPDGAFTRPVLAGFVPADALAPLAAVPSAAWASIVTAMSALAYFVTRTAVGPFVLLAWILALPLMSLAGGLKNRWLGGAAGFMAGWLPLGAFALFGAIPLRGLALTVLLGGLGVAIALSPLRSRGLIGRSALRKAKKGEARRVAELSDEPGPAWGEIGGYAAFKERVRESIVLPWKNEGEAKQFGLAAPKGILLFGPPGCGKTLMMRALAKEVGAKFFFVKTSDLLSKWVGESEKNLSALFDEARAEAPSVVFLDEIDAIGRARSDSDGNPYMQQLLNLLLVELDELARGGKVLVVAATNRPDVVDPALKRPGRFDLLLYLPEPDAAARAKIFEVHLAGKPLAGTIDYADLAARTDRFSGADIENVCREAAQAAFKVHVKGARASIDQRLLLDVLGRTKPSLTHKMIEDYRKLAADEGRELAAPSEADSPVEWSEVAGLEEVKRALVEAVELPLKDPERVQRYRLAPARGVLLFGPPGCGKTFIAKAAARRLGVRFVAASAAEVLHAHRGESEAALRGLFARARENAPALLFLDEIDAIAGGREGGGLDAASRALVTQLLTELDGVRPLERVVVLAATNRPWSLDPALLRPGRFDIALYVPPPDAPARRAILDAHLMDVPLAPDVDIARLAIETDGLSGADLVGLLRRAKLAAVRDEKVAGRAGMLAARHLEAARQETNSTVSPDLVLRCVAFGAARTST